MAPVFPGRECKLKVCILLISRRFSPSLPKYAHFPAHAELAHGVWYAGFQGASATGCSGVAPTVSTAQALNTVLAFVSSRKHLATTFPVIRSSVEGLLKRSFVFPSYRRSTDIPDPNRPLDLAKVAELKWVTPNFMTIPTDSHPERFSPISSNSRIYPVMSYAYTSKRSLSSNAADVGAPTFPCLLHPSFLGWKKKNMF